MTPPEITIDLLQEKRIAVMWFYGKPRAARYESGAAIVWYEGETVREAVSRLLAHVPEATARG